jgi:uncharacterized membrane protein
MKTLIATLARHMRFYIALTAGVLTALAMHLYGLDIAFLAGGDVFYLVFLGLCLVKVAGETTNDLKQRAKSEDEGILIVLLISVATMAFFCVAVFTTLNMKHALGALPLVLAGVGVVAGWLSLHTVMAFHYANIHYFDDPDVAGDEKDLAFPGKGDPGPWDFLYYAFVVGMTAQVSDVQVLTTAMRKATLFHGLISFFFNTVFIAMAVNAGVALAAG